MRPGQKRLYWAAVNSLREAETLAQLGNVSGPADEPPQPGDEESWTRDWVKRAGDSLKKARDMVDSHVKSQVDRGKRIAVHVRDGASAIQRASQKVFKPLGDVAESARSIAMISYLATIPVTVLLLGAAYWLWKRK